MVLFTKQQYLERCGKSLTIIFGIEDYLHLHISILSNATLFLYLWNKKSVCVCVCVSACMRVCMHVCIMRETDDLYVYNMLKCSINTTVYAVEARGKE